MAIFGGDVDYPYRLLELEKNYTYPQLKSQYRKMVFRYHPDKTLDISSSREFKILTVCYKHLLRKLRNREGESIEGESNENKYAKCHTTFKSRYEQEVGRETPPPPPAAKNFNIHRFNKEYEQHHYIDPIASRGYDEFLRREDNRNDQLINKGHNGYDVLFDGPQPLDGIDLSECYELGGEYKNLGRTSVLSKGLHFMDLHLAHTTSKIIDEENVRSRPDYKSLDDIKAERGRPIELTHAERIELENNAAMSEEQEEKRRLLQVQRDREIAEYHARAQNILMR